MPEKPESNIILDLENPRTFWSEVAPPDPEKGPFIFKRRAMSRNATEYANLSHFTVDDSGKTWTIALSTAFGIHTIDNGHAHRGIHDWVPLDWELVEAHQCWAPPGTKDKVALASLAQDPSALAPIADEHHNAWRARVTREHPFLDSAAGKQLLGEV